MFLLLTALLGVASGLPSLNEPSDPFQPGPFNVTLLQLKTDTIDDLAENLDVWVPTSPGKYPVLYYLDGFAMGTPGLAYGEILSHLASHGMAVIAPWFVVADTPEGKLPYFKSVLEWVENNLLYYLQEDGLSAEVSLDFETLLAGAHSAGSHVLVSYLKESCGKFKGMHLTSPVDGVDPMGLIPEYCIHPGQELNFIIPTLHISAGLDSIPGSTGFACAPKKMSNERFWNAFHEDSPRWSINATYYSHADLMDDEYRAPMEETGFCAWNSTLSEEQYTIYRQFVAGTATAFFKALTSEDCSGYLQYLEDPNVMLITATERHINPTGGCPRLSCTWMPETFL